MPKGAEGSELVRYESMVRAIAECHKIDEVKQIRDKAKALQEYSRQAQNVEAEQKAYQIRMRAERKAGDLLKALKRSKGGKATHKKSNLAHDGLSKKTPYQEVLESNNIAITTAKRWQDLAEIPDDVFEAQLASVKNMTQKELLEMASTVKEPKRVVPVRKKIDSDSLWLWGRLNDFKMSGLIYRGQREVYAGMSPVMKDEVRANLPKVLEWLSTLKKEIDRVEKAK